MQNTEGKIEIIDQGATREQLHDGRLVIYTITSPTRETIDAWMDTMIQRIAASPSDFRFYTMYELAHTSMAFTPYIRKKFEDLTRQYPNTAGCTAIVIRQTILTRIARLFIEREMQRRHKTQTLRIFFDRNMALGWLEDELQKAQ